MKRIVNYIESTFSIVRDFLFFFKLITIVSGNSSFTFTENFYVLSTL